MAGWRARQSAEGAGDAPGRFGGHNGRRHGLLCLDICQHIGHAVAAAVDAREVTRIVQVCAEGGRLTPASVTMRDAVRGAMRHGRREHVLEDVVDRRPRHAHRRALRHRGLSAPSLLSFLSSLRQRISTAGTRLTRPRASSPPGGRAVVLSVDVLSHLPRPPGRARRSTCPSLGPVSAPFERASTAPLSVQRAPAKGSIKLRNVLKQQTVSWAVGSSLDLNLLQVHVHMYVLLVRSVWVADPGGTIGGGSVADLPGCGDAELLPGHSGGSAVPAGSVRWGTPLSCSQWSSMAARDSTTAPRTPPPYDLQLALRASGSTSSSALGQSRLTLSMT